MTPMEAWTRWQEQSDGRLSATEVMASNCFSQIGVFGFGFARPGDHIHAYDLPDS